MKEIRHCVHCSFHLPAFTYPIRNLLNISKRILLLRLMPSSHLPRTPCDKFVYDFPCDFLGIVGGYGLRRMCSHCLRASCDFFYGALGATRGKSVQRLCGDCTEIVQCQCSCRAVSAAFARKSYGARAGIGLRTVPVRGLCNATYSTAQRKRLGYLVGNLVATNWPIEKALHAIGCN